MARAFASFQDVETSWGSAECRYDTRLYFGDQDPHILQGFGRCVGVIYLQNPGSAEKLNEDRSWGPLIYDKEQLLPHLQRILDTCLDRIRNDQCRRQKASRLKKDAYLQILNLSYLKKANDKEGMAIQEWRTLAAANKEGRRTKPVVLDDVPKPEHAKNVRFVIFGWGDKFNVSADTCRVVKVLQTFVTNKTVPICPLHEDVRMGKPLPVTQAKLSRLDSQIPIKAAYPKPFNAKREFVSNYVDLVSKFLAKTL